jgi:hypothetical protein
MAMDEVTERIESWRRDRRLRVADLAAGAHMSLSTCKRRRRRGDWNADDLAAVARVLEVKAEWLAGVA